jgi:hypothetical protein
MSFLSNYPSDNDDNSSNGNFNRLVKYTGGRHMVAAHMNNNPSCVCPRCTVRLQEVEDCLAAAHADPLAFSVHNECVNAYCDRPLITYDDDSTRQDSTHQNERDHFHITLSEEHDGSTRYIPGAKNLKRPPVSDTSDAKRRAVDVPAQVQTASQPTLIQSKFPNSCFRFAVETPALRRECNDLFSQLREAAAHLRLVEATFHSPTLAFDVAVPNDATHVDQAVSDWSNIGFTTEGTTTSTYQIFSRPVADYLLEPLQNIGVTYLSTAADLCPVDETTDTLRVIDRNHKACFLFTPMMIKDKKMSFLNNHNKPEILNLRGRKVYNREFWTANLNIKNKTRVTENYFRTIEMAAFIPDWTVAEAYKDTHKAAMRWMSENAAVFPTAQSFYLSLKQEYATVFVRNMESPLVAKARLAGYHPLFLLKNAIIQETKHFGLHGHQLTTINILPKSYLALVGFFAGSGADLRVITLQNDKNSFMVLANSPAR